MNLTATRGRRLALSAAGGMLMAFALPTVFPIWGKTELLPGGGLTCLAYVAMIPLFAALERGEGRGSFALGFVFGLGYFSVAIWWIDIAMHTFGGIPNYFAVPVLYLLILFLAVHWGAAAWLARRCADRLGWPLWLLLPPIWTAFELVRNYLFSGYPWGDLGYTLARFRLTAQWASLFGVYGLAFLVVLYNGALYELGKAFLSGRRLARAPAAALVLALLLPNAWGAYRIAAIDREVAAAPKLKVAIVQPNVDQKIKNGAASEAPLSAAEYRDFILQRTLPLSEQADRDGAQLIAWPEASFPIDLPSHPARLPPFGIPPLRAQLLVGGVTFGVTHGHRLLTNSAFAVDGTERVLAQYDKHHLVPFGEYVPLEKTLHLPIHAVVPDIGFFDPGDDLQVFTLKAAVRGTLEEVRYAPLICYDAIFPEISAGFAREDPDFLVNLTNDAWYGFSSASYQFLSMVTLRAIETGKALVRPANTGISAFIDPAGRVVSRTALGLVDTDADAVSIASAVPPVLLEGQVPLLRSRTPYVVLGDSFAYLCAAFAAAVWFLARKARA
ncbi:MAG: apolipoprotein N-acyltransferase [Myxococcales bacterium]